MFDYFDFDLGNMTKALEVLETLESYKGYDKTKDYEAKPIKKMRSADAPSK